SPIFSDEAVTLARFQHAPDEAFDYAPAWLFDGMAASFRAGAARLAIAGQDADKVARANRARSTAYRPAMELISNFATNWNIVSYATPSWARTMFPDL